VTGGPDAFTNTSTGILELSTNVTATLLSPFSNQGGLVETATGTTGTLVLGGGGSSAGGFYNAITAGAFIDLAGANISNFTGTYTGSGAGIVGLFQQGGILAVDANPFTGATATLAFTAEQ